jgi:hypothetical protein
MGGDIGGELSLETVLAAVSTPAVLTNNLTSTVVSDGGFTLAYNCNKVLLGPSFVSSLALGVQPT